MNTLSIRDLELRGAGNLLNLPLPPESGEGTFAFECPPAPELGRVDVVDLKGAYHGTPVDTAPDPLLYRRVAEGLPTVFLEDPALTPDTEAVLADHRR